eukprot:554468_1
MYEIRGKIERWIRHMYCRAVCPKMCLMLCFMLCLGEALRIYEEGSKGVGHFSANQKALASQQMFDAIISGSFLPNHICIYLVSNDQIRWTSISDTAAAAPGILYKKTENFAVFWADLNGALIDLLMSIVLDANEREIIEMAKEAMQRVKEMNDFINAVIVPIANNPLTMPKKLWKKVIICADINRDRVNKKKQPVSWSSESFHFDFERAIADPHRMVPSMSAPTTARIVQKDKENMDPNEMKGNQSRGVIAKKPMVCWHCGASGHRRSRCNAFKEYRRKQKQDGRAKYERSHHFKHRFGRQRIGNNNFQRSNQGVNAYYGANGMQFANGMGNQFAMQPPMFQQQMQGPSKGPSQGQQFSFQGQHQPNGARAGYGAGNPLANRAIQGNAAQYQHRGPPRKSNKPCNQWAKGGRCFYGDRCKFVHG